MGRIYNNLKRIFEKSKVDNTGAVMYQDLLNKFATLLTYEDTYLGKKRREIVILQENGKDMFLDCGGFGIIVTPKDEISIHT